MHRKFRSTLTTKYINEGKTPELDQIWITQEDWDAFDNYCQLDEFRELSEKGEANQSQNLYPHFLGSRNYSGEKFQSRLKDPLQTIANENGSSSDLSSQGSTTASSQEQFVDMSIQHRHIAWKLAREKLSDNGRGHDYPSPNRKAVVKTIEEQGVAFKKGMLTVEQYDDVLGNSLPNPEHPGGLRGVGTLREVEKRVQEVKERLLERLQEVVERLKRDMEATFKTLKRDMEVRVKTLIEQQMAKLMGQRQMDMDGPRAIQSSCRSVESPHFLDSIEGERRCKLHLIRDGKKIEVAIGMVNLPVLEGTVVHGRPILPGHARVMVDAFHAGEENTPVPVPNGELVTIRSTQGSFTAWPMDMISLDEFDSGKEG